MAERGRPGPKTMCGDEEVDRVVHAKGTDGEAKQMGIDFPLTRHGLLRVLEKLGNASEGGDGTDVLESPAARLAPYAYDRRGDRQNLQLSQAIIKDKCTSVDGWMAGEEAVKNAPVEPDSVNVGFAVGNLDVSVQLKGQGASAASAAITTKLSELVHAAVGGGDIGESVECNSRASSVPCAEVSVVTDVATTATLALAEAVSPDAQRKSQFRCGSVDIPDEDECAALKVKHSSEQSRTHTPGTALLANILLWWSSIEEPPRRGTLKNLITHRRFDMVSAAVIFVNGVVLIFTTDYEMQHLEDEGLPMWLRIADISFIVYYTGEVFLKLCVHGLYFFCDSWNRFDFAIVVFSIIDSVVVLMDVNYGGLNLSFLRACRIFKVARMIRVFRGLHLKAFLELRLMLDCVLGSFYSLFWCLLFILFILYIFALYFVQALTNHLNESNGQYNAEELVAIEAHFGTVFKAMFSLFAAVTGGTDWQEYYDIIAADRICAVAFVFFICFFVIAVFNIIASIFIDQALKVAQPDIDSLLFEKHMKDVDDARELMNLFQEWDVDHCVSGGISRSEFTRLLDTRQFFDFLHIRGLDVKDAQNFYDFLSEHVGLGDDDREVPLDKLVGSLLRMKGVATSIDLHVLGFEIKEMMTKQALFRKDQLHFRSDQRNFHRDQELFRTQISETLHKLDGRVETLQEYQRTAGQVGQKCVAECIQFANPESSVPLVWGSALHTVPHLEMLDADGHQNAPSAPMLAAPPLRVAVTSFSRDAERGCGCGHP